VFYRQCKLARGAATFAVARNDNCIKLDDFRSKVRVRGRERERKKER
jgi:hypothetical protein